MVWYDMVSGILDKCYVCCVYGMVCYGMCVTLWHVCYVTVCYGPYMVCMLCYGMVWQIRDEMR